MLRISKQKLSAAVTAASIALMLFLLRIRSTYPMVPYSWMAKAEVYLFVFYAICLCLLLWWLLTRGFNRRIKANKVVIFAGILLGSWGLSQTTYGAIVGANAATSSRLERICLVAHRESIAPDGLISREKSIEIKIVGSKTFSDVYFRRNSVDLSAFPVDKFVCIDAARGPFGFRLYRP